MNILVVRTDKLGDFITALPSLYLLKKYNPSNRITACVAPMNRALAKACSFIDEVIVDDGKSSVWELSRRLKRGKFDISFTLFSNTRVAMAQFLAGIPKRYAPATKIAQIFYNHRVVQRRSEVKMPEFAYNIELIKEAFPNISTHYLQPLLAFEDAKEYYKVFCKEQGITKEVIAFHVGFGGSSDANWSEEEYTVLVKDVLREGKYNVVLTFGPDEEALRERMRERLEGERVTFYLSNDGIVNFAKLISNFRLFVSTSTGTYHLASLVGCATMTFFGESKFASAARWQSVGDVKLQQHYMLPQDAKKREEMFAAVRQELQKL